MTNDATESDTEFIPTDEPTDQGHEGADVIAPRVTEPVKVTRIVVPLDGSPFAERALPVANWVAGVTDAKVHLVEVVASAEEAEDVIRYLDSVGRHHHATSWDVLQSDDVPQALVNAVAGAPHGLVCLATHGRDRSAALVGSVAASLLDRSAQTALLVGPQARARHALDATVVAAVDGSTRDEAVVHVALGWAARLTRPLVIATVAEPAPALHDRAVRHRAHGPADPERYLAALAERVSGTHVAVDTLAIYDPVSVAEGLVPLLEQTAALVVLGSRHRHGMPRMVLGSHAARIVHDAAVPALVVPLSADPTPSDE